MANKSYKGRTFEIALATQLSLWWTEGERDDVFWHTHDSGGRATKRAAKGKKTKNLHGDICAVDPIGQPLIDMITFEAKRGYNRHTLADLLDKPDGAAAQEWEKWIEKAHTSQVNAGSLSWMIVAKRDRRDVLCVCPMALLVRLGVDKFAARIWLEEGQLGAMKLAEFLNTVHPNRIRQPTT